MCEQIIDRKYAEQKKFNSREWQAQKIIIGFELWCNCTGRDMLKNSISLFREYLRDDGAYKLDNRFLCRIGKNNLYDEQVKRNYKDAINVLKIRCDEIKQAQDGKWRY